jgi:uncharacterized protein YyaL (SSP411 family)
MQNRLADQTSPYLRAHAGNPVAWQPWDAEALDLSKSADKPIFLSIGYSACHWCHVMEHESFADADLARLLNEQFVPIKVDREERPDLDQLYMQSVQAMTGRGGWPMSVFLTPRLEPFYGGTYWPPEPRHGMPGFGDVLSAVAEAWRERRSACLQQAEALTLHLRELAASPSVEGFLSDSLLGHAATVLERVADRKDGGFGGAPKFPHPMDLRVLLRAWRRSNRASQLEIATFTLDKMAGGGIYDHLGGGFHRYSVDAQWLVPHFEKMLYDNALLAGAYVEAWQATGRADYARIARETLDYLLRDMTDAAGGIYSTEDADSEGHEGKFYVWTPAEIAAVLGEAEAQTFCRVYDVSKIGNFEGQNILNLPKTLEQIAALLGRDVHELATQLAADRARLLAARSQRVRPALDDKVLASWNGLAIEALAAAGAAFDEPRYLAAAERAANFVLESMRQSDGRLWHVWRQGRAHVDAFLDDYACVGSGLVSLYEATFDARWLDAAVALAELIVAEFADRDQGGFFYTSDQHEALLARQKDIHDSSTPSASAMTATLLVKLGKLTGRNDYLEAAGRTLRTCAELMQQSPTAAGQSLIALDLERGPTVELVFVAGTDAAASSAALADIRQRFWPRKVLAGVNGSNATGEPGKNLVALLAGKPLGPAEPTLYVCEGFACREPVVGVEAIRAACDALAPLPAPG